MGWDFDVCAMMSDDGTYNRPSKGDSQASTATTPGGGGGEGGGGGGEGASYAQTTFACDMMFDVYTR